MPNAAGRRARRGTATTTKENEEIMATAEKVDNETTAAPVEVPDFLSSLEAAEEDYKPNRSPAGRKPTPSQFESVLPGLKGKGYQRIPHDGQVVVGENGKVSLPDGIKGSSAQVILRELEKAQHRLELGLDKNVTATHVEFRVRDKQERKPRADKSGAGDTTVVSGDGEAATDTSGDA